MHKRKASALCNRDIHWLSKDAKLEQQNTYQCGLKVLVLITWPPTDGIRAFERVLSYVANSTCNSGGYSSAPSICAQVSADTLDIHQTYLLSYQDVPNSQDQHFSQYAKFLDDVSTYWSSNQCTHSNLAAIDIVKATATRYLLSIPMWLTSALWDGCWKADKHSE